MASLSAWRACSWAALMSKVVAVSTVCFSRSPRTCSCQLSHSCLATAAWRSRDWTSHAAWRMSSSASIVLSAKSRSNCVFRVCSSHSSWVGAIIFNSLRLGRRSGARQTAGLLHAVTHGGQGIAVETISQDLQNRDVGPHGYARCHCGLAVHPCHRHRQIRDRGPRDGGLVADAQQPAQLPFDLPFAGVQFDLPANQFEPLPLQGGIIGGQRDSPLLKLPVVGDRLIGFPQTAPQHLLLKTDFGEVVEQLQRDPRRLVPFFHGRVARSIVTKLVCRVQAAAAIGMGGANKTTLGAEDVSQRGVVCCPALTLLGRYLAVSRGRRRRA